MNNFSWIDRLEAIIPAEGRGQAIYADSAEPDRIQEIFAAGFNIHPSVKGVTAGIDVVKRFRMHITKGSPNIEKEIRGYSWKRDKNGNILDEPIRFNDHAMKAIEYAVHSHFKEMFGKSEPYEEPYEEEDEDYIAELSRLPWPPVR